MEVIETEGVVKEYRSGRRRLRALDEVDLTIRSGEAVGLLGPNGAGKTTFVKCLLGLLRPTGGSIRLFGHPPEDPRSRRRVGYAPEMPSFPSFLSAEEVLRLHARLIDPGDGDARTQVPMRLEEAGLDDAPRRIKAFSKGMVRRLALAQAFLGTPDILVLDEPTADLDPIGRREVRNHLLAQLDGGRTILLNSHLLSEVESICDRVAIIHEGRILALGPIEELVAEGQDLETVFVRLIEAAQTA